MKPWFDDLPEVFESELPPDEILFHLQAGRLLKCGPDGDRWWLTTLYPYGGAKISKYDAHSLIEFNWVEKTTYTPWGIHAYAYNWNAPGADLCLRD